MCSIRGSFTLCKSESYNLFRPHIEEGKSSPTVYAWVLRNDDPIGTRICIYSVTAFLIPLSQSGNDVDFDHLAKLFMSKSKANLVSSDSKSVVSDPILCSYTNISVQLRFR